MLQAEADALPEVPAKVSRALPAKMAPVKALMEELTITVDDAAVLLRLSRHGAYAAIREGHIPSIRIGRVIRVPTAALRATLGLGEVGAS